MYVIYAGERNRAYEIDRVGRCDVSIPRYSVVENRDEERRGEENVTRKSDRARSPERRVVLIKTHTIGRMLYH